MAENVGAQIILHHLDDSRSQRVLWLLEELGVPYTIKYYKRQNSLAPKELVAVHPLGKSPVIEDGDTKIAESGAIVEYLIDTYGKGRFQPPEKGKLANLYYTHFGEGSMMPLLVNYLIFTAIPKKVPWFLRWLIKPIMNVVIHRMIVPTLSKAANMIEGDLGKSTTGWFAGGLEPTSADFMMLFPMETLPYALRGDHFGPAAPSPNRDAWLQKAHARPAYGRALEKGGEYAYIK